MLIKGGNPTLISKPLFALLRYTVGLSLPKDIS